jgi:hypothetical protein
VILTYGIAEPYPIKWTFANTMECNTKMTSSDTARNETNERAVSPLVCFNTFLESLGVTSATGWRFRKRGWVQTVNLAGRLYIARSEIERFHQRAASGEFRWSHKTPNRRRVVVQ